MIADPYRRLCTADVHQAQTHTCDDPTSCGIASIGEQDTESRIDELLTTIDQVRDLCAGNKSKLAQKILSVIVP